MRTGCANIFHRAEPIVDTYRSPTLPSYYRSIITRESHAYIHEHDEYDGDGENARTTHWHDDDISYHCIRNTTFLVFVRRDIMAAIRHVRVRAAHETELRRFQRRDIPSISFGNYHQ